MKLSLSRNALDTVERYLATYQENNWGAMESCLDPERFHFSHHNRSAYAETASDFVELMRKMAEEVVPDGRYTEVRSVWAVHDVVVLSLLWDSGKPITSVPGLLEEGVTQVMHIKSMFVVENGLITELRDHD